MIMNTEKGGRPYSVIKKNRVKATFMCLAYNLSTLISLKKHVRIT